MVTVAEADRLLRDIDGDVATPWHYGGAKTTRNRPTRAWTAVVEPAKSEDADKRLGTMVGGVEADEEEQANGRRSRLTKLSSSAWPPSASCRHEHEVDPVSPRTSDRGSGLSRMSSGGSGFLCFRR